MRHRKSTFKLGRDYEQKKALIRGLLIALVEHRKIQTTIAKAKAVQPEIESLISLARQDTPQARRVALSRLANKDAMRALFAFVPTQYADRQSGFTRITKLGPRLGDGANMVVLELL
jgi:large subunit ribosomal protein L17